MNWIYFSPHLDDVALSCGGLVWEQNRAGLGVHIWTICAGDPPPGRLSPFAESLHERWQIDVNAVEHRRREDIASCAELGAEYKHMHVPDCIYRRGDVSLAPLYASETDIFGLINSEEAVLIDQLSGELLEILPDEATLVCPLTLGGHVDHKLTRAVLEKLLPSKPDRSRWELWYYADYPYARKEAQTLISMQRSLAWNMQCYPVTADGLLAWEKSIAAYASQISTFWPDLDAMRVDLRAFASQEGGICLWQPSDLYREQAF
jgi:LmbE family N-acetylglucosaminyl deacetylase